MKFPLSGPLIGILTASKKDGTIAGNGQLFTELQKKLISYNGISFVFTLDHVRDHSIYGFTYLPDKQRWVQGNFRYPDIIYNRIPFRITEQTEPFRCFIASLKEKRIPFFNPCFIDKFELYDLFNSHSILKDYLPRTIPIRQKQDLLFFINAHKCIYLKPAKSSKGKGIYRLKLRSPYIHLEGINQMEVIPSFDQFWEKWSSKLQEKEYLAQESIDPEEYEGYRFDFRILAHGEGNTYVPTGVGIRQSQEQEVTTHIPSGGRLLPYERIQTNDHDHFIQTIVPYIGKALSERFGYFGEFSIDAGVSKTGQYFIYEVNSKPMSFDEPEIEERKIEQLCRLFLQLANFH
ncbi:YheC/YheD family protein [Bacillus sp. BRMEA1]|uniref:YheC/YheD family endospore coat-associated protein n=1 Tax=Neobacillus endophyticus TaxID=2738405 RepID=UPI0015666DCF|nr:YheC/YheD family protein [Neobacillus endophyticus]NRD78342.1 YheC/YheD family protein [Neobacillus endophyticus]